MNGSIQKFYILTFSLIASILIIYGCKENTHIADENGGVSSIHNVRFGLTVNDNIFVDLESQDSVNNISTKIHRFMDSLGLSYNNSDTPHGLALLYSDLIDTTNFNNLEAVLYFFDSGNEDSVKVWIDNSGTLLLNQDYSRISHYVLAFEDLYRFDYIENLGTNQAYLLLDQTALPADDEQYPSEFQTEIDKNYSIAIESNPDAPDEKKKRLCSNNFIDCPDYHQAGTCGFTETQTTVKTRCSPDIGTCLQSTSAALLNDNSTPFDSLVTPDMHKIERYVLLNNTKYEYMIEDFYYLSSVVAQNFTLSIALDVKDLSNTNFLDIFKNYNNPSYADSILITSVSKPIILDICNATKLLTTDSRATNIINNTISLTNTYENKTITYIKNN
jgi:hypothetical protein